MDKEDFIIWLRSNRSIKEYSVNRYANAIPTISSEMKDYGINQTDLFETTDTMLIDKILLHPEFLKKDKKGNRMYSSALKHFKTYIEQFWDEKSKPNIVPLVEEVKSEDQITNRADLEYKEGKELLRLHKVRERDPQLIKDAKRRFKKLHGELFCEACGINFEKVYGERGKDFIEGHHKKPVSEMKEGETTKVEDIGMLCSNCHRMIHRIPMVSIEELKKSLRMKWV
ncbi:HNH endonuclease [Paenibacillus peoriae]|uniref:HNH endonuclease n=1 Tax=Paenibacillus peoriae TaxID=59893 RepID=UPI00215ABC18|nr:HNH endonuclease [Paenibacillus peoriae]